MSAHNAPHRRHAASNRRRLALHKDQEQLPSNVHVLDPRYSPTAIYSGMATQDSNAITLPGGVVIPGGPTGLFPFPDPDPTTSSETEPLEIPITPTTTSTATVIVLPTTSSSSTLVPTTGSTTPVVAPVLTTSRTPTAISTSSIVSTPTISDVVQTSTFFQTSTRSASLTSSAAASSTGSAADTEDSTNISTGAVVGGIGAGLAAIAAIGFAVVFFIRRSRKSRTSTFDPNDFRRSAMMIDDPPTHEDTIARGYNPRPPTMIERHLNSTSPAPTFGTKYGAPAPGYPDEAFNYGMNVNDYQGPYPSFAPGQIIDASSNNGNLGAMSPGYGPTSADPLFPPSAYTNQSPFSPIASPVSATMYNEHGQPVSPPILTRQPSHGATLIRDTYDSGNGTALNRQPSYGATRQISEAAGAGVSAAALSFYPAAVRQAYEAQPVNPISVPQKAKSPPPVTMRTPPPPPSGDKFMAAVSFYPAAVRQVYEPQPAVSMPPASPPPQTTVPIPPTPSSASTSMTDYVDLTRSSVSPFQAAQYVEISRKLNAEPPKGLDSPAVDEIIRSSTVDADRDLPPVPAKGERDSPFADPATATSTPHKGNEFARPISMDSISQDMSISQELEFPAPPSPAATYSSRYRVDSTPPMLPEIHVGPRVSVSSYGTGFNQNSPMASGFPSGVTTLSGGGRGLTAESRFPTTPSPLASSFGIPTPPVNGSFEIGSPGAPNSKLSNVVAASREDNTKRPETVYDPEDAYGGF